jgi:hypothetical protein
VSKPRYFVKEPNGGLKMYDGSPAELSLERENDDGNLKLYKSSDGFMGTLPDVATHMARLEAAKPELRAPAADAHGKRSLYQASDGFRGTFEEVVARERASASAATADLYEASDGFRGSLEAVVVHRRARSTQARANLYESDDGKVRGTLAEVQAYVQAARPRRDLYEALDGYRGTLEEVQAHERGSLRLFESDDGTVRGSLAAVEAYEKRQQPHQKQQKQQHTQSALHQRQQRLNPAGAPFHEHNAVGFHGLREWPGAVRIADGRAVFEVKGTGWCNERCLRCNERWWRWWR